MADIWFDVDAAISEAPINIMPLIDATDFKTREESVTFDQAGLDLVWNFVTTAGAMTQTAVTPTDTAGAYDWVNQGNGMYSIEIPATGGATINNNTEGFGWFTGFATGVLPWRGPVIGFRAAGLNDALIDGAYSATRGLAGTALPAAAADAAGGLPISDAGGLDLDAERADVAAILVDTGTTLDGKIDTIDGIVDSILVDTAEIGAAGAGLTAINLPNQTMDIVGNITGNLSGSVGSVTGAVGSVTGAVGSVTGSVGSVTGNVGGNVTGSVGSVLGEINTTAGTIKTLDALDTAQDSQHSTTQTLVTTVDTVVDAILLDTGTDGVVVATHTTAAKAELQSEADDALVAKGLDHLVAASVTGTDIADNSIIARLASKSATADWDSFTNTTDALEALADAVPAASAVADAVWDEALSGHTTSATFGAVFAILQKLLRNKIVTDPTTGRYVVYDDDDVTPLFTANIYEGVGTNHGGSVAYRGRGAEVRARLA